MVNGFAGSVRDQQTFGQSLHSRKENETRVRMQDKYNDCTKELCQSSLTKHYCPSYSTIYVCMCVRMRA